MLKTELENTFKEVKAVSKMKQERLHNFESLKKEKIEESVRL